MSGELILRQATLADERAHPIFFAASRTDFDQLPDDVRLAVVEHQSTMQLAHYRTHYPNLVIEFGDSHGLPACRLIHAELEDHVLLVDIVVLEKFRGNGFARRLIKRLQTYARSLDKPIRGTVRLDNVTALHLYRSMHFEITSSTSEHGQLSWSPDDTSMTAS